MNYGELDVSRYFTRDYKYQLIENQAETYDYFQVNAPDFTHDINLGFSNGFKGHNDEKWEILIGGWRGIQHVMRDGNQRPHQGLVRITNKDR